MGLKDDFFVSRTIEAYMDDKSIKTAIVINDPASFIKDFNNMFHSMTTKYAKKKGFVLSEDLERALPNFCENWVNQAGANWGNAGEAENLINSMVLIWKKQNSDIEQTGEKVLGKQHIPQNKQEYLYCGGVDRDICFDEYK